MRPRVANAITFDNFWLLLGLVSIAPFLIISYYNQPSVDDFYFTVKSQSIGALNAQIEWYLTWTGRYFSTFILSINPLVYNNLMLYKTIPVLLIVGLWLSLSLLVQAIFINIKTKHLFFISTSIMTLFFFQMPSISQGVYWLAGAVTYQLGNILFVFCLCSLI